MRVRLEGGAPEAVPSSDVHGMYGIGAGEAVSPDGKLLALNAELSVPGSAVSKLALVNL